MYKVWNSFKTLNSLFAKFVPKRISRFFGRTKVSALKLGYNIIVKNQSRRFPSETSTNESIINYNLSFILGLIYGFMELPYFYISFSTFLGYFKSNRAAGTLRVRSTVHAHRKQMFPRYQHHTKGCKYQKAFRWSKFEVLFYGSLVYYIWLFLAISRLLIFTWKCFSIS